MRCRVRSRSCSTCRRRVGEYSKHFRALSPLGGLAARIVHPGRLSRTGLSTSLRRLFAQIGVDECFRDVSPTEGSARGRADLRVESPRTLQQVGFKRTEPIPTIALHVLSVVAPRQQHHPTSHTTRPKQLMRVIDTQPASQSRLSEGSVGLLVITVHVNHGELYPFNGSAYH
jgi:hypothetical protein